MKYVLLFLLFISLAACQLTDVTQEDVTPNPNPNTPGLTPNAGVVLANNTSEPLYYILLSPLSAQPLRQKVDIPLNPGPKELIEAGATAELESFDCAGIEQLSEYQLILYRVDSTSEANKAEGTLLTVKDLSESFLKEVRSDEACQINLGTFISS